MTKIQNNIPFGLKNGVMYEAVNVESGLKCGCICPSCGGKLQANKGKKRHHYFSHDPFSNIEECRSAFESSVHMMAKQILEKNKHVFFPLLEISLSMDDLNGKTHTEKTTVSQIQKKDFTKVELEKSLDEIRPDIIAYSSSHPPTLIEVAVTSFSSEDKKRKIRNLGLYAIEIDLSNVSYLTSEGDLTKFVLQEVNNKTWLSNPDAKTARLILKEKLAKKVNETNEQIKLRRQAISDIQSPEKKQHIPITYIPIINKQNKAVKQIKQHQRRHFVCDACRYKYFDVLIEIWSQNLKCPACGHSIAIKET